MPSWPLGSRPTTPVSPRSRTMAGAHRIPRSSSSGSHSALRRRRRSAYLRWRWRRAPSHSRFLVERDPQRSADGGARPTFAGDGGGRIASRGRRRTGPAARSADGARPTLAGDGGGPIASHVRRRTGATARSADGARPTLAGDGGGPSHPTFVVEREPQRAPPTAALGLPSLAMVEVPHRIFSSRSSSRVSHATPSQAKGEPALSSTKRRSGAARHAARIAADGGGGRP